jgi:peptidoglycan-associated lipoprotein
MLREDQIFAAKSLEQLHAEKPLAEVYFDLDESSIRDDARPILQCNADWMKRWASTQVTVEGHCDSRGSAEYNLALGTRRATSVKDYLVNLGVPANRVTVVTKGKEQPVCSGETEGCWQQNRRRHFIITAKEWGWKGGRAVPKPILVRPSCPTFFYPPVRAAPPPSPYFATFFPATNNTGISSP